MSVATASIVDAILDENLFRPFFGESLNSWKRWITLLKAIYGLPIRSDASRRTIREVTGRDPDSLNPDGYQTTLIVCGRRSGKSRMAAVIGAYSAALAGLESKLDVGEQGLIAVVGPTAKQGTVVRQYIRSLFDTPILRPQIIRERSLDTFTLRNGNRLEILSSDRRSVRGFTLLGCVVDEIAFLGLENSSRIRTDSQLITSLQPSLATTGGKLIAITTPWAKVGWTYETFQKHWGNNDSQDTLVINAPSRTLNKTLPQSVVDRAMREDLAAAKSEYMGEFRDDVISFIPIELVEKLVVKHRYENLYRPEHKYSAFVDLSGGRNDASALAIGHRNEKKKVVLDVLDWHQSPHDPFQVIAAISKRLESFGIRRVIGDAYSAEFAARAFKDRGISYTKCELTKSALYAELLPVLCTGDIELLDDGRMVKQMASLERRTRSGGKDSIDHPPKGHDDLANAVAGCSWACNQKKFVFGVGGF